MLSIRNRFHGYNSLRPVYRHGATVRSPQVSVKYQKNPRRATYRVAVVVSRKVNKSAVKRNRIRRRLYEVVRKAADTITGPYDIVITVFSDQVGELPPEQLEKLILGLLAKADIIKPASRDIVKTNEDR